jgi:hypothetical protein
MRFVVEYIFDTQREWACWFSHGIGSKTAPMTVEQFISMDKRRQQGEYIFFKIEVIK